MSGAFVHQKSISDIFHGDNINGIRQMLKAVKQGSYYINVCALIMYANFIKNF